MAAVILFTPQCAVERQALTFEMEQYAESPDPDVCSTLSERIDAHNAECNGSLLLDCN